MDEGHSLQGCSLLSGSAPQDATQRTEVSQYIGGWGDLGTSQPWRENGDAPFLDKDGRENYERGVRMRGDVTVFISSQFDSI